MQIVQKNKAKILPCLQKANRQVTASLEWADDIGGRFPKPSHISRDDIRQAAWEGLVQASRRYDGKRSFYAFAHFRVRGAIQDYLRRQDYLSRGARKKLGSSFYFQPEPLAEKHEACESYQEAFFKKQIDPYEEALKKERLDHAKTALRKKNPRDQQILREWLRDQPMHKIAKAHAITESRVSQICASLLGDLRGELKEC